LKLKMPALTINLKRQSNEPWGFNLSGGKDQGSPITISEIKTGSPAEKQGLKVRDTVVKINQDTAGSALTAADAEAIVKRSENLVLLIERMEAVVEDPRYEGLDEIDRAKVGNNDVSKPTLRRDWNCPWVKRDGKGLKKVVRNINGTEPAPAPVKTSQHHFYSEPQSILAPEGPPIDVEELERAIAEKMLQEEMARNPEAAVARQQQVQIPTESAPDNCDPEAVGPALSPPLQNVSGLEDEEDLSCPPDLEEVSQKCDVPDLEETCERGEEEEAAIRAGVEAVPSAASFSDNVVQALTQAIKESMQNYQDMGDNYEPSADELIDVLKNLENLAAVNPALYRAIVDQIKGLIVGVEVGLKFGKKQQQGNQKTVSFVKGK